METHSAEMRSRRHRARPSPQQEAAPVVTAVVSFVLVWWTVGPVAAGGVLAVLVLDWVVLPGRRVLAFASVTAMLLVPVAWSGGSLMPLWPAVARAKDNLIAHQVGGLALWLLFLTVVVDVVRRLREERA